MTDGNYKFCACNVHCQHKAYNNNKKYKKRYDDYYDEDNEYNFNRSYDEYYDSMNNNKNNKKYYNNNNNNKGKSKQR